MTEAKAYRVVNLSIASIFFLVFIYSAIFNNANENHPIPSFHTEVTGEPSLSTGLSRSFSAIVRLQFDIAHQYNPYGLLVFLFFLEQLILRISFFFLLLKKPSHYKTILILDLISLAIGLFVHFRPFIFETVYR